MNIGIVGLGLIGGSIGLKLQSLNHTVFGIVNNNANQKIAIERKLATYITTDLNVLKKCSLIVLALPIRDLIKPHTKLIEAIPKDSIITDVASIKDPIINTWENLHPLFVGSHPMAGTEYSGVNAGKINLLENAKWIITTTSKTNIKSVEILSKLISSMNCEVIFTTPNKHDLATSLISHLPIFLAASLIETASNDNDNSVKNLAQKIAASGFYDTSRVGGGNSQLGRDLAEFNQKNILNGIKIIKANLGEFEKLIKQKDWISIYEKLEKSKVIRSEFFN